jgi:hypothetical protein
MKPLTAEWVDKAEGDFLTAGRELHGAPPNYDAAVSTPSSVPRSTSKRG